MVSTALEEIEQDDLLHVAGSTYKGSRRAVVFYMDRGTGAIPSMKWWLFAWHFIGLDASEEAFDIVVLVHPHAVKHMPAECKEIDEDHIPNFGQPGECLYKIYMGKTDH